jgi:hypothetical protein
MVAFASPSRRGIESVILWSRDYGSSTLKSSNLNAGRSLKEVKGVPLAWLVEFFAREVEKGCAQQREHRYAK